jgi:carbon-monoxide dehydrogenase medium subunit
VQGGKIQSARVGLTGATTHAVRLAKLEQALTGATQETIGQVAANAGAGLDNINSDIHASEEYRRAMVAVFAKRALAAALARA